MQTFAMLTRLTPGAMQSPRSLEELERKVMDHIRRAYPSVECLGSYAVLDYLDIFCAAGQIRENAGNDQGMWRERSRAPSELATVAPSARPAPLARIDFEIAEALGASLDLVLVRKIGVPGLSDSQWARSWAAKSSMGSSISDRRRTRCAANLPR